MLDEEYREPRRAVLFVIGKGVSYIFESEIFSGIYIFGGDFFHQILYFWVINPENI